MDSELSLAEFWSIGEQAFSAICQDAGQVGPTKIVEFRAGPSSVRLAQAFPAAHITSVDNWSPQLDRVRALAERHDVTERLEISHRPLIWQWHAAALYHSYAPGDLPAEIDVVVIDGPRKAITPRGREACLHQAIGALRVGGRVYLDDYRRASEQHIVRNWLRAYPEVFRTWVLPFDHQICVLEKVAVARPPRVHPSIVVDVGWANIRRGAERMWELVKSSSHSQG